MSNNPKKPYETIYLQWSEEEVSWCQDRINDDDITYTLKSTADKCEQELRNIIKMHKESNCCCVIEDNEVTEYCALHAYMQANIEQSNGILATTAYCSGYDAAKKEFEEVLKPIRDLKEKIVTESLSADCYSAKALKLMIDTLRAIKETLALANKVNK
jgi:hypothetical protein